MKGVLEETHPTPAVFPAKVARDLGEGLATCPSSSKLSATLKSVRRQQPLSPMPFLLSPERQSECRLRGEGRHPPE